MSLNPQYVQLILDRLLESHDVLSAARKGPLTEAAAENRRGRFMVSVHLAHDLDFATLVDSNLLVTAATRRHDEDLYIVDAFSPLFDKLRDGDEVPLYLCKIDTKITGTPVFKMERRT